MENEKTYLNQIDDFTIKLPFMLNEQQKEVLREVDKFVKDPFERVMTISGWAGTGKTTLMEIVYGRYWQSVPNIQFSATTHKAAAVLRSKVKRRVTTVNSLFGIMVETDMDGDTFDASKKKKRYDTEKLKQGSLVIIDEASMLTESNYNDVINKCTDFNCKVIFIGDSAQLAPVGENDISIVFRNDEFDSKKVIELTKVERTDDDSIINEATRVRIDGHLSYESSSSEQNGVLYIKTPNDLMNVIDTHIGGLTTNPNHFRILTYTNKNVEKLNDVMRQKMGYGDIPEVGEPLMSYSNWGYEGDNQYAFTNSESYTVEKIVGKRNVNLKEIIKTYEGDMFLPIIDIDIKDALGCRQTIPYIDVKHNKECIPAIELLCREKINLWRKYKSIDATTFEGKKKRRECVDDINNIEYYMFVNENIRDAYGNLLQQKVVDFGYAHTIHKSQGSTFDVVLMNDMDIENNCRDKTMKQQLRYVGVTRAKKLVCILTNTH